MDFRQRLQAVLGADYAVERELGGGGMSRVFLAEERRLGRRVVVKVLGPEQAATVSAERFQREVRLAAQLQDPRIIPVLAAGSAAGISYYTMPFVDGESLRSRMAGAEPVPRAEALGILRDIALALEYAHARQVVHRDIKPENVLLAGRTAVVTDFGIAKAIAAATEGTSRATMTEAGTAVGTPAYMAPEQAAGDPVDHRADIYAWGVVAYELLTGAHPFASHTTAQALMAAHLAEAPTPLSRRAPDVPGPLAALVDRALAKDRNQRPATAAEMLRVLDRLAPPPAEPARRGLRPAAWLVLALAAVALIVWVLLGGPRMGASGPATGIGARAVRSLAVLPFTSPDRDSANAYFGAGMAEELTTAFARVPGIRVASRGSASRFQDAGTGDAEIARELRVESLLEGSVRRSGQRIRVSARLVDPRTGTVLWADQYDRRLAQVFDVQDEMARAIVSALLPKLADTTQLADARAARGTADLDAYDLYLKGRYNWSRRGEIGLRAAMRFFEGAIQRDSTFARAWAGLSMTQVVLPYFTDVPAESLVALARRNAERALRLDSTLPDAHLALAYALKSQWRWDASEQEFRRALALAPGDATIHHWYGVLLYVIGRIDEGVAQERLAQQLDPLAPSVGTDLNYALYIARRYDEALAQGRRVWAMDTTKSDLSLQMAALQLARGRPDSAVVALEATARLGTGFDVHSYLSVAYRQLGRTRAADSLYSLVLDRYRTDPSADYAVAIAAGGAGDLDRAMDAVRHAIVHHSLFVTELSLPCDPSFDPLKRDPRFGAALAAAGMRVCPPAPPQ